MNGIYKIQGCLRNDVGDSLFFRLNYNLSL